MKLSDERRWCLSWWERDGWSPGRVNCRGMKKWERHIDMLVKAGLLEADTYDMLRITEAGRQALNQKDKSDAD